MVPRPFKAPGPLVQRPLVPMLSIKCQIFISHSDDLWCLSPSLTSAYIVPLFQRHWQAAVQTASRFNALHNLVINVLNMCDIYWNKYVEKLQLTGQILGKFFSPVSGCLCYGMILVIIDDSITIICATLNCGITINVVNYEHMIIVQGTGAWHFCCCFRTKTLQIKYNYSQSYFFLFDIFCQWGDPIGSLLDLETKT